jgi:hypothetical protein
MKIVEVLRRMVRNSVTSAGQLDEIVQGISNQSRLINDRLREIVEGTANQSSLLNDKLGELIGSTANQSRLLNDKLTAMIDRQNVQLELQKVEIAALREFLCSGGGASALTSQGRKDAI